MISNNTSTIYYLSEELKQTKTNISFVKKVIHAHYSHYDFVNKEVFWLQRLATFDKIPSVAAFDSDSIIMDYMGKIITKGTVPFDWKDQVDYIIETLKRLQVSHNDIKLEEILVKDGKINLIDFQHATNTREEFEELRRQGKTTVEPYVKDDRTSLYSIIGELV